MELNIRSYEKIVALIKKGVEIPNPLTLDIGAEVDLDRISGNGVTIYPGCRISGKNTVISAGTKLGYEGPVTLDDCQLGPHVELKGGYFTKAVFLEQANLGLGAHVREGCILEEEANGAHCVGLKQTILFPFVTLGSLINFCDCLMAGGTSRKDHSEVGSSYIHFNFTPDGDKTTASLIGDVPRGVMLNQPAIFLGGQGGIVGPVHIGYGDVIAAGTLLRTDIDEENKLVFGTALSGEMKDRRPNSYSSIARIVSNNIRYLANLAALEQWYTHVRRPFFQQQEFGDLIYAGAMVNLASAKDERLKRLQAMADKAKAAIGKYPEKQQFDAGKQEFHAALKPLREMFCQRPVTDRGAARRDDLLAAVHTHLQGGGQKYLDFIKGLSADTSQTGVQWLEAIVTSLCAEAHGLMPSLDLFKK